MGLYRLMLPGMWDYMGPRTFWWMIPKGSHQPLHYWFSYVVLPC